MHLLNMCFVVFANTHDLSCGDALTFKLNRLHIGLPRDFAGTIGEDGAVRNGSILVVYDALIVETARFSQV